MSWKYDCILSLTKFSWRYRTCNYYTITLFARYSVFISNEHAALQIKVSKDSINRRDNTQPSRALPIKSEINHSFACSFTFQPKAGRPDMVIKSCPSSQAWFNSAIFGWSIRIKRRPGIYRHLNYLFFFLIFSNFARAAFVKVCWKFRIMVATNDPPSCDRRDRTEETVENFQPRLRVTFFNSLLPRRPSLVGK